MRQKLLVKMDTFTRDVLKDWIECLTYRRYEDSLSLEVLFLFRSSSPFASLRPPSYFPVILCCSFVDKSKTPIEIEKQSTEVDKMSKVMKFLIIWKPPLGNFVCASNLTLSFRPFFRL